MRKFYLFMAIDIFIIFFIFYLNHIDEILTKLGQMNKYVLFQIYKK